MLLTNTNNHTPSKSGYLEVFAESGSWKKRWCVLKQRQLSVLKKEKDNKPLLVMDLGGCGVKSYVSMKKANCFQIHQTTQQQRAKPDLILCAPSAAEMEDWMKSIQSSLNNSFENKMTNTNEISPSDLEWSNEIIGKGGSGLVKKGLWLKSIGVAIKTLNNLPEFTDDEELTSFYQEISILSDMRHPNVVSMFGFCRKEDYICLVTEYIPGGDLFLRLKDSTKPIPQHLKFELALSISAAMIYLHGRHLIHRDLKPGNILIEDWDAGKVKVCDFGLSRMIKADSPTTNIETETFGSPAYAAPELNTKDHTNKVDVFSFSIILWEIDTKEMAWQQYDQAWLISDAIKRGERLELPSNSVFSSLISRCWRQDPNFRPEFNEIFDHLSDMKKRSGQTLPPPNVIPRTPSKEQIPPSIGKRSFIPASPTFRPPLPAPANPAPITDPPGKRILQHFDQNSIPWPDFVHVFMDSMGNPPENQVQGLRWVLTEGRSVVERTRFEQFLKWFSPLIPERPPTMYANTNLRDMKIKGGYTTSQIVDIVGPRWFHGWISAEETKLGMANANQGAFLFRFSQNPPNYSLSVMHMGQVTHWRIACSKETDDSNPIFQIDDREYASIKDIVHKHMNEPLKVFQLLNTGKEDVYLKKEHPRDEHQAHGSPY